MNGRPILVATIGYIVGILWGLYLKINIILFYFFSIGIYFLYKKFFQSFLNKNKFQLVSFKRYSRYFKLIIRPAVISIFIIFSVISNYVVIFLETHYEKVYEKEGKINLLAIVQSGKEEKQYYNQYKIKVILANYNKEFEQENLYIQVNKEKFQ